MASVQEADQAIVNRVAELAPTAAASTLVKLAEALAWVQSPAQPHGSQTKD